MSTWDTIKTLVSSIVVSGGVAFGVVKFLSKSIVKHQFKKNLEEYRTVLEQKTERLKHELALYAHEQNVVVSRVDAQRAEAIAAIYSAICVWSDPMTKLIAGSPVVGDLPTEQVEYLMKQAERAHTAGSALAEVLTRNAIYLNENSYRLLAEAVTASIQGVANFLRPLRMLAVQGVEIGDAMDDIYLEYETLSQYYTTVVQPRQKSVVTEFRKLLHVDI